MVKVSVIVPVYRLGAMVNECLEGLRAQQTPFETEMLIIDDASPDDSWTRMLSVAEGDRRFRLFRNETNRGLAFNQKRLLAKARGEYIAYMDGDDIAYPGKLEAMTAYLDTHPGCSIVYHEAEVFDHDSGQALYLYSRDHYNARYVPPVANVEHLVKYGCFLNASSVMFRRHDNLDKVVDDRCRILLDYPMHILNAGYLGGTVDRIDRVLGRYRLHAGSSCGQNAKSDARRIRVVDDQVQSVENAARFGVDPGVIAAGKAHHRFAAALFFLKQGKDSLFRDFITLASEDGCFFDDRHRFAYAHKDQPQQVSERLFGAVA